MQEVSKGCTIAKNTLWLPIVYRGQNQAQETVRWWEGFFTSTETFQQVRIKESETLQRNYYPNIWIPNKILAAGTYGKKPLIL